MAPKYTLAYKLRFPILFGSGLLGAYVVFLNRYYLMGDLTAKRDELLVQEDKEARAICEEAMTQRRKLHP